MTNISVWDILFSFPFSFSCFQVQTHNEKGERIRYENDDNVTLEDLVRQEKMGTRDNFDMEYASRITSDTKFEDDFDYMDDHAEEMAKSKKRNESQKKNIAISGASLINYIFVVYVELFFNFLFSFFFFRLFEE